MLRGLDVFTRAAMAIYCLEPKAFRSLAWRSAAYRALYREYQEEERRRGKKLEDPLMHRFNYWPSYHEDKRVDPTRLKRWLLMRCPPAAPFCHAHFLVLGFIKYTRYGKDLAIKDPDLRARFQRLQVVMAQRGAMQG